MNRTFFAFCLLLLGTSLAAQKKEGTTYLVFNPANMSTLEYRSSNASGYPTISQVLRLRTAADEYYFLEMGTGIYSSTLPEQAQNSQNFVFTDQRMTDLNNRKSVLQIVQPAGGYSVVSPVLSVTRAVYSGNLILLNGADFSLMVDKTHSIRGNNVATPGSLRDVLFLNVGKKACKEVFTFRRISGLQGSEMVDFDFIQGIGIVGERVGRTTGERKLNERTLRSIDGKSIDELIQSDCGFAFTEKTPTTPPTTGTVNIGPKVDEGSYFGGELSAKGVMISAISNHPIANCGKNAELGFHIVQPKETISSIARFYGLSPRQIIDWNQIANPNLVSVCQELRILPPGAKTVIQGKNPIIAAPAMPAAAIVAKTPASRVDAVPALAPAAPSTTLIPGQNGRFYSVQPGENLYQVAKKFGYTEERLRTMNTLPAAGEVPLQVGQLLKVSDCEEQVSPVPGASGAANSRSATFSEKDYPTMVLSAEPIPSSAISSTTTVIGSTTQSTTASTNNSSTFVPLSGNPTATNMILTPTTQAFPTPKEPLVYQDYKVTVAESIRSIALKKKLDPTELGLINGRAVDEILPLGTKILIPVY